MATEAAVHMNGTYAHHQSGPYHADPYHASVQPHQPSNASTPAPSQQESKNDIPKDEVAWFFVEQYYTTLSRSPEKLHLFYSRKSQFVSGNEAEKVGVSVGQSVSTNADVSLRNILFSCLGFCLLGYPGTHQAA